MTSRPERRPPPASGTGEADTPDPAPTGWARRASPIAAIGAVAVMLYANAVGTVFQYDDKVEILLNRVLRDPLDHPREVFAYNPFRFLLMMTFAADLALSKASPDWFHRVNIGIHAVNGVLVYALLRIALPALVPRAAGAGACPGARPLATLGALAFVSHPLAVESVTYVSGRSESLAFAFCLAALLLWARLGGKAVADPAGADAWEAAVRGVNRALLAVLAAAAGVGGPVLWAVRNGHLGASRGALVALAGVAAALAGLALSPAAGPAFRAFRGVIADGRRTSLLGATFVLYLLGSFTKETAAALPALLATWDLCVNGQGRLRHVRRRLSGPLFPFLAIPATLLVLRAAWFGYVGSPEAARPVGVNLLTQAEVAWRYAALAAWPVPLSIYHDHPEARTLLDPATAAAALGIVGVLAAAVWSRARAPAFTLAVLFAAFALAPSSSFFPLKETMAEHRTYPALFSLGVLVAAGAGTAASWSARYLPTPRVTALLVAAGTVLVGLWGARVVTYNRSWATEKSIWERAVALNPRAAEAWYQLGDLARYEKDLATARSHYERCLRFRPDYVHAWNNLGILHGMQQSWDEAEEAFRQAAKRKRCYTQAMNNMGRIHQQRGRYTEAARLHQEVLATCDPQNYLAHRLLGDLYYGPLREPVRAMEHYQEAYRIDPLYPDTETLKKRLLELSW